MMKKQSVVKKITGTLAIPFITLAIVWGLCAANGMSLFAGESTWRLFVQSTATVMLVTFALSINLNSGRFDFSLGAVALLSSILSAKLCLHLGGSTPILLGLCIAFGILAGIVSGVLYVVLKLPAIITSLGVALMYEGLAFIVTGGYGVSFVTNQELISFPSIQNYLIVIALSLFLVVFIFDFTKFGCDHRALMHGQKVAVATGVREVPNAIGCYAITGALMGVVGFMSATRTGTIQMSLNFSSIGVMFTGFYPMFVGGFVARYSNERIGYLMGALSSGFISLLYLRLSVNASVQQIITALVLVGFVLYLSNENKLKQLFAFRKGPSAEHR